MHLLNTDTLQLESFADNKIPSYAILSHRWGKEEISYQKIQNYEIARIAQVSGLVSPLSPSLIEDKAGFVKIKSACKMALEDGHKYMWIDTCCIDKKSSAELSEAINSMYNWYSKAVVCYTYLSDVHDAEADTSKLEKGEDTNFKASQWFTRGWTLQELIASTRMHFYSQGWREIGTKISLKNEISTVTGVDIEVLEGKDPRNMSVAKRMFWASQRETERQEDIAYCLMGLFDVNMPLLYGEGEKAFARLQEEILKTSDDHSIFAWKELKESERPCDLLAPSPAYFAKSGDIVPINGNPDTTPYTMTNQGLRIELPLTYYFKEGMYLAPLNCTDGRHSLGPQTIALTKVFSNVGQTHRYVRISKKAPRSLIALSDYRQAREAPDYDVTDNSSSTLQMRAERKTIYILRYATKLESQLDWPRSIVYKFQIRFHPSFDYGISTITAGSNWNWKQQTLSFSKSIGVVGGVTFFWNGRKFSRRIVLIISVDVDFTICLQLYPMESEKELNQIYEQCKSRMRSDMAERVNNSQFDPQLKPLLMEEKASLRFANSTVYATVAQDLVDGEAMYVINLRQEDW